MAYNHQLRIRYGECDQQGVVFNANYMAYIDDATDVWIRSFSPNGDYKELNWEWMVVKSIIEWQSSARNGDLLNIQIGVIRYGGKSFDLGSIGTVGRKTIFSARTVCVSVEPETYKPIPTPDSIQSLLGNLLDIQVPD